MNCLLLGGAGFIGSHLARALIALNHRVVVVDNYVRSTGVLLPEDCAIIKADLCNEKWWPTIRDIEHHWIFNLASVVGVPNVERAPGATWKIADAAVRLMMTLTPVKTFFASTSEVYGGLNPVTRELDSIHIPDPMLPRSVYAISKVWGESALITSGRPFVIGRFHNIYGPAMGYDHVIPRFCQQLVSEQNPVIVDDPRASRAFCYIDDCVDAIIAAMDKAENTILNIGNPSEPVTMRTLMRRLMDVADLYPDVKEGTVKGWPRRRCPDISRIKQLTGWAPKVGLTEGLRRTWEWYRTAGRS